MSTSTNALMSPSDCAEGSFHKPLIIAVAFLKGGVGRTTLAVTLAGEFHRMGYRTLFADSAIVEKGERGIVSLRWRPSSIKNNKGHEQRWALVPSNCHHLRHDRQLCSRYDIIIVDPASSEDSHRLAASDADLILLPLVGGYAEAWRVDSTLRFLRKVAPDAVIRGVRYMEKGTRSETAVFDWICKEHPDLIWMSSQIKRRTIYEDFLGISNAGNTAGFLAASLFDYSPSSKATLEIGELSREIIELASVPVTPPADASDPIPIIGSKPNLAGKFDPLYDDAVKIVSGERTASVSFIQRKLSIGYNRAARLLDHMQLDGLVGPPNGSKPRLIIGLDSPSPCEAKRSTSQENKPSKGDGFLVLGEDDSLCLDGGSFGSEVAVILGKRGRGKTHLGSLIVEQIVLNNGKSHEHQRSPTPFVIIDPVGSWHGLQVGADAVSPGIPIFIMGGKHGNIGLPLHPGRAGVLAAIAVNRLKYPEGVILDLHRYDLDAKCDFVGSFVGTLQDEQIRCPEDDKESIHVFIDEIHQFAPQSGGSPKQKRSGRILADVISASRNAEIAIGFTLITQRPARASKDILSQHDHLFVFELNGPDLEVARRWLGRSVDMSKLSQFHYWYAGSASRLTGQVKSPLRTTCSLSASRRSDWSQKKWRKTANLHRAKIPLQIIANFQLMMGVMSPVGDKKSQKVSKLLRLAAGTSNPHEAANARACADKLRREGPATSDFSGMEGFGEP